MSASDPGDGWARTLAAARSAHPVAGLASTPARLWHVGTRLRHDLDVVIAEDHGGFALGGNKVRHLDVILGGDEAQAADTWVTAAGSHSNLCRVLAAAGALLGRRVELVLRGHPWDHATGNQVVYDLSGASITWVDTDDPFGAAQDQAVAAHVEQLRRQGRRPFLVDVRETHAPLSALAETGLVDEVAPRIDDLPDSVVVAAGAGSTAAGLWLALAAHGWPTTLIAVSVNVAAAVLDGRIRGIADAAARTAGIDPAALSWPELVVTDHHLGAGYRRPTPAAWAAISATAAATGLMLDPTYTGKSMAGLLAEAPPGRALFVHTGGTPALFDAPLPGPADRDDPAPTPAPQS